MKKVKDLTGMVFGRLTVVGFSHINRIAHFECRCECGNTAVVSCGSLKTGNTKSCGCLKVDFGKRTFTTHGKSRTKTYQSWENMKARCLRKSHPYYDKYGGRGIVVCATWKDSFEAFLADMGECPDGMTLERVDNNGNYCPENCRWDSRQQQAVNRRCVVMLFHQGKTMHLAAWSKEVGIHRETIREPLKRGWPVDKALTTPAKKSIGPKT